MQIKVKLIPSIKKEGVKIVVYEPVLEKDKFNDFRVIKNLDEFKNMSDVIVANRLDDEIKDVVDKIYTRDLFSRD